MHSVESQYWLVCNSRLCHRKVVSENLNMYNYVNWFVVHKALDPISKMSFLPKWLYLSQLDKSSPFMVIKLAKLKQHSNSVLLHDVVRRCPKKSFNDTLKVSAMPSNTLLEKQDWHFSRFVIWWHSQWNDKTYFLGKISKATHPSSANFIFTMLKVNIGHKNK